MGNPYDNALPRCQLFRLQKIVTALYAHPRPYQDRHRLFGPSTFIKSDDPEANPIGLWIDTLCVPVHDDHVIHRIKAIRSMKSIYENAHRVVVLDAWVEQMSRSTPIYEIAARLYLSNWQHRLWTLQEGVLAQNLFFRVSGGFHTLKELGNRQLKYTKTSPGFYESMVGSTLPKIPMFNMTFDVEPDTSLPDRFQILLNGIANRTTTRSSDETICFATILGLDPVELLMIQESIPESTCEKRMIQFLRMIGRLENGLIFNNLPRIETDGYRWAPRSFLGQNGAIIPNVDSNQTDRSATLRNGGGLLATLPGLIFTPSGDLGKDLDVIVARWGSKFRNIISLECCSPSASKGRLAVLSALIPGAQFGECAGILGEIIVEENDYFKVRHLCSVKIIWHKQIDEEDAEGLLVGEWLYKQQWCVV